MYDLIIVWSFLNTSLISSIVGGVFAGLTVGIILYLWTGNRDQNKRLIQVQKLLQKDIDLNLKTINKINQTINENNSILTCSIVNNPLKMSGIKVAAKESYIQAMEPNMAILVSTLQENGEQLNNNFNYIKTCYGEKNFTNRFRELEVQLPDLISLVEAAMISLKGEIEKNQKQ